MTSATSRWIPLASALMATTVAACGTSGSNPPALPEVHFVVRANPQPTTFQVTTLSAGGVRFTSLDSVQFPLIGNTFDFVIENAAPDYTEIGRASCRGRA